MAWFIIALMALSIIGFVGGSFFAEPANSVKINGYTFINKGNWVLKDSPHDFTYLPSEVEQISTSYTPLYNYGFTIAYDPEDEVTSYTAARLALFAQRQNLFVTTACAGTACNNLPIYNCSNPTLVLGSNISKANCISFNHELIEQQVEHFMYQLLGILPQ